VPVQPALACATPAYFAPRVICRLLASCVAVAATLVAAQTPPAGRFQGTGRVSETSLDGEFVWRGNATLRDRNALFTADEIRGNHRSGEATATGNVVFTRGTLRLLADKLVYHRADESFSAEHVRVGSFPYYVEGDSASGKADEIVVSQARVTYGEPGRWQPTLTADRVVYAPNSQISSDNAQVGVGGLQPLPFPKFRQNLAAPFAPFVALNGGYRSSLGVFAEGGLHLPVALGVRLGAEVGLYSQRGVMIGPGGHYHSGNNGETFRGSFSSGYINDHGDKGVDILGFPVPEDRAFIEWQHQSKLAENLTFNAQLNWWKDSEVVRDFRPRKFFPVQAPDTFLESTYTGKNYFVSLFARFQPNDFQRVQERLPEVRFDLLPTAIGGGIYERAHASYVRLKDSGPISLALAPPGANAPGVFPPTQSQSDRFDAYYALSRPITPTDWLSFTPVAGARFTYYDNIDRGIYTPIPFASTGPASVTRTLGEIGFDAALRASGTFAYKNQRWKIDGLRHLFTPRISYRYIPEGDEHWQDIPPIDRNVFSTYLQPLGLGDQRNVDTLRATNTLRLALDNVLQTRDATGTVRDLATLNLAADFRYERLATERDVSEIHTELALMPAHWLQLDLYSSFRPQDFSVRELNTGITLRDADVWSLRFSNNFLRGELEDYYIDGRARINETFAALTRLHYDARTNRFNEQAYGLIQNLGNTWQISYVVTLYSGRRRESRFGFNVEFDALRF
jgi:LPS-assembly protein